MVTKSFGCVQEASYEARLKVCFGEETLKATVKCDIPRSSRVGGVLLPASL